MWGALGSRSIILDWHYVWYRNYTCVKKELKLEVNFFLANSYLRRSYRGKTGGVPFCLLPISLGFKSKPWITLDLQKSIFVKNKVHEIFINKKDHILKDKFHTSYKKYGNLLSTLKKKSKQAYYDKYFERNWNNVKSKWKGTQSLVSVKTVAPSVPIVLSLDIGDTITSPYDTANTFTFNNYFASVAETTKSIKYSHKDFSDYPLNESSSTKFLQFTDKEEIVSIISTLDSNKMSGPKVYLIEYFF